MSEEHSTTDGPAPQLTIRVRASMSPSGWRVIDDALPILPTGATQQLHETMVSIGLDPADFAIGNVPPSLWQAVYHVPTGYRFSEIGLGIDDAARLGIERCMDNSERCRRAVADAMARQGAER